MPLLPDCHVQRYFAPGGTNVFTGPICCVPVASPCGHYNDRAILFGQEETGDKRLGRLLKDGKRTGKAKGSAAKLSSRRRRLLKDDHKA